MQWMQYAVDTVEYWYMVVGTLSLIQKGQSRGRSGCSIQYTVRSRIVVYGGGDIVFGAKRSNQRMQ